MREYEKLEENNENVNVNNDEFLNHLGYLRVSSYTFISQLLKTCWKNVENMLRTKTCWKYVKDKKYVENMLKLCWNYVENMLKICSNYVKSLLKVF